MPTDLELVMQAMSIPTDLGSSSSAANNGSNGLSQTQTPPPATTTTAGAANPTTNNDPLTSAALPSDILTQLSTLSPSERTAIQPILDALASSSAHSSSLPSADSSSENTEMGEEELNELLGQMEAADQVAGNLEKKLDELLSGMEENFDLKGNQ